MKRSLIAAALLLTACAPRTDVIASGVSATLSALAPTPILPEDRATSTAVPTLAPPSAAASPGVPTDTAAAEAAPTEGPASATAGAASETVTAESAATTAPSATALVASTPLASTPLASTPLASASLAAAAVGELIFQDTFDSPGPWSVGDTESSNVAVSGGVMSFTQKTPGSFSVRIIGRQGADFYTEVTAALAGRCASGDRYGLMFRVQDPSNYYAFQVDCDGRYRLVRYVADAAVQILDWTSSDAIQRGQQSTNTLAVTARGGSLLLAINDTALTTAADDTFTDGRFGLMVGANVSKNFTVLFDNLRANHIP